MIIPSGAHLKQTTGSRKINIKQAVDNIAIWMSEMRLNCEKTEAILFGNPREVLKCKTTELNLDI